jgi:hypothetical protein
MSHNKAIGIVCAAAGFLLTCASLGVVLNPSLGFFKKAPRPAPRLRVLLKFPDRQNPDSSHLFEVPAHTGTFMVMPDPFIEVEVSERHDE